MKDSPSQNHFNSVSDFNYITINICAINTIGRLYFY